MEIMTRKLKKVAETTELSVNFFPKKLRIRFAAHCALHGRTQKDALIVMLKEIIASNPKDSEAGRRIPGATCKLLVREFPQMLMRHFAAWCKLHGVIQRDALSLKMLEKLKGYADGDTEL